ncbi:MAG: CDP-archaeol synthase [Gammaproteobacteria bacterium]
MVEWLIGLLLLGTANGAPILARNCLHERYAFPVDLGLKLPDGHPLFGSAKTWRGLFASIVLTASFAWLTGMPIIVGVKFAAWSMTGDLLASFCKRRLGQTESSRHRGLDRLPESLLPLWILKDALGLGAIDIVLTVTIFFLSEEFLSPLLYKWHIRRRPY